MTLLAGTFLFAGSVMAQTNVSGTVTSGDDGEPVIGAAVKVEGTNTGTVTDVNGHFQLNAPAGAKLVVTYLGMKSQTVKAGGNMKVVLQNDSKTLDELVVVGYGSARKLGTITGTVGNVKAEKVNNAPSSSVLDNLQGQVAGLNVLTSSGEAGDNAVSINIHGIGSLGASSTPLYVIDGIPSTSTAVMAMNPNDIKSVTVLKDASSTSIYGSQAANGVIYVTTKGGDFNSKASITYRTQYGWNTLANKSIYEDMMNSTDLYNFWLNSGLSTAKSLQTKYAGYLDENGLPKYSTKWYNIFQNFNTPQTQNDVTFQGGSDRMAYLVSGSQFHQKGTEVGNYYDKFNLRTKIDTKPFKWLSFGINSNVSYSKQTSNPNWGNSSGTSNYISGGLSYMLNPIYTDFDPETGETYEQRYPFGLYNPNYVAENTPDIYSRYGLNGNAYIDINPIRNLHIKSVVGTDLYFYRENYLRYPSYASSNGSGSRAKATTYAYSHINTNTIEYSFDVAQDHHITVLGGEEGRIIDSDYYTASSTGQYDDRLMNLQNGRQSSYSMSESASTSKFLSFFGRVDYNYGDRYFLDASLRNDASSRFGKNHRNATFWSVGGLWKIKNEAFMAPVKWVNSLDFKVNYGTQGNAGIGNYASLALVSPTTFYNEGAALAFSQPENNNLTWEKQKTFTIGVAGRLWDRFNFDVSYYVRKTSDMLMSVPYPYTTGFSSVATNVGGLQNKGIDLTFGVDILKHKDYYLNFNTTFNYNSQKITELFQGRNRYVIANTLVAYVVGSPVEYYLPIYAGVDPADGAPMWYKAGDDVDKTTKKETTKVFSEAALTQNSGKKRFAPVNGGFSINGGWKGIYLNADFSYTLGKYMVNNDAFFYDNPNVVGTSYNQRKDVQDFWTAENPNAKYPAWGEGYQLEFDTHLLENASFLRLKNLVIGYNLPKKWLAFQNVLHGVNISFTARNLFTITNYTGIDPEVDSNLTYGVAGNTKQYLFGLSLTF